MPQLNTIEPEANRQRTDSVKDKTKIINDQLNDVTKTLILFFRIIK